MPAPINPNALHTYVEWAELGYQVQRGSRHVARRMPDGHVQHGHVPTSLGVALFSAAQVAPVSATPQGVRRTGFQQAPRRPRPATGPEPTVAQAWGDYFATFAQTNTTTNPVQYQLRRPFMVMDEIVSVESDEVRIRHEFWQAQKNINEYQLALEKLERGGRDYVHPDDRAHPGLKKLNDLATKLKEK